MSNPNRSPSDVAHNAINAGMDVVFGEEHSVVASTMQQIQETIEGGQDNQIDGVILELPETLQQFLDPQYLQNISREQFADDYYYALDQDMLNNATAMLNQGLITPQQFNHIREQAGFDENLDYYGYQLDQTAIDNAGAIYDMARTAAANGVPVIAGDVDRQRGVAAALLTAPDGLNMSVEEVQRLFQQGMSDSSDLNYAEQLGIDLNGDGSIIVHRGLAHINGFRFSEDPDLADSSNQGFDDLLEDRGRSVVTIDVLPDTSNAEAIQSQGTDPTDFSITIDGQQIPQLDRSDYLPQQELPLLPLPPLNLDGQ